MPGTKATNKSYYDEDAGSKPVAAKNEAPAKKGNQKDGAKQGNGQR